MKNKAFVVVVVVVVVVINSRRLSCSIDRSIIGLLSKKIKNTNTAVY